MTHACFRLPRRSRRFTIPPAAVARLRLEGRDGIISQIKINTRFTVQACSLFCSGGRGVVLQSVASRPGAQESLPIKLHKYLQQLIPT